MGASLLVVAGEPSGDRIASDVLAALPKTIDVHGVAGPLAAAVGEHVEDASFVSTMGLVDPVLAAPRFARLIHRLRRLVIRHRPVAALLVNFSGFNQLIGTWLKNRGVRVLWCGAPQVWAWRSERRRTFHRSVDRMAVLLPFEVPLWKNAGIDAHYVGFPGYAASVRPPCRPSTRSLALLLGSRSAEIARCGAALLKAAERLRTSGDIEAVDVLVAPGNANVQRAVHRLAQRYSVDRLIPTTLGAAGLVGNYQACLATSGTATLEAALAGSPPVIVYRTDPVTFAVAKRWVRIPNIGLPNVLLGRAVYPECIQQACEPASIVAAARQVLDEQQKGGFIEPTQALRSLLTPPSHRTFGAEVAALLMPWLE